MNRLRIPVLCLALLAVCAILCSAAGQDKAPATDKSAFRYCKENMGTYTGARAIHSGGTISTQRRPGHPTKPAAPTGSCGLTSTMMAISTW